jgi:putative hydrolase
VRLLADLHTHTIASGHAYSTVTELADAAVAKGLELIAVIDHGPSVPGAPHPWHFWNMKVVPSVYNGLRILKGVEANPSPHSENGIDLPDMLLELLDFVSVGFHPLIGFYEPVICRNTDAILRVLENPYVDMIVHPGNGDFPIRIDEFVASAAANNVIIEINNHSFDPNGSRSGSSDRELEIAAAALAVGAPIAIGSDAHYHLHVGRFEAAIEASRSIGLTQGRVVNRSARAVLEHLEARRPRPRLDFGGEVFTLDFRRKGSEGGDS